MLDTIRSSNSPSALLKMTVPLVGLLVAGCDRQSISSVSLLDEYAETNALFYALPRGLVTITVARKKGVLTMEATPTIVADQDHRYQLDFRSSAWALDTYSAQVSQTGLLETAKSDNKSQVSEILESLAKTAGAASGLSGDMNKAKTDEPLEDFSYRSVIDPFVPESVKAFNNSLSKVSGGLNVTASDIVRLAPLSYSYNENIEGQYDICDSSFCFRLPKPVVLKLNHPTQGIHSSSIVTLPDPSFTAGLKVTRSACVHKTTNLTFTDGMLVKNDIVKPSQLLGCVSIPLKVVAAFFSGVTEAVTGRTKRNEDETKLLSSRIKLLEEEMKLREALAAARAPKAEPSVGDPL